MVETNDPDDPFDTGPRVDPPSEDPPITPDDETDMEDVKHLLRDESREHMGGVLDPEDLDVTQYDEVNTVDDNRFVISTGDSGAHAEGLTEMDGVRAAGTETPLSRVSTADATFAIELAVKSGRDTGSYEYKTDNVVEAFESVVEWYVNQIADDDPETALQILLEQSKFEA